MQYIDVLWFHEDSSDPYRLVSELDGQRYETRKLEFFRSGLIGFASTAEASFGTELGTVPVPTLEEINADPQFKGRAIDSAEFVSLWELRVSRDA